MIRVTAQGVEYSDLEATVAEMQQRQRAALGEDLALEPETPQGQLNGIVASKLVELYEAAAQVANGNSVDHAAGVALRDQGSFLGLEPRAATFSRVTARLTGVAGTLVPAGSRAMTLPDEQSFETMEDAVLSSDGVNVEMQAVAAGPVPSLPGTLTKIVTLVPGWETVTNAAAGVVGRAAETDADYRAGYQARTGRNTVSVLDAMRAALTEAGATRLRLIENRTSVAKTVQGWVIAPHSLLVVVLGGTDLDVQRAVEGRRNMGLGTLSAIRGGTPDDTALGGVSNGTVQFDGIDYMGLNLTGAATPAAKAAALGALVGPVEAVYDWPAGDGYYTVLVAYDPAQDAPAFDDGTVETAFGLDPDSATAVPGSFIRPRERELTVTADVTPDTALFPGDGLEQLRTAIYDQVAGYGIGQQLWANDVLSAMEAVPGTRVTSLTVQEGGRNASGADVPPDTLWKLPAANLNITVA